MADIQQSVTFQTSAGRLFEALVEPTQHAAFTGAGATGDPVVGAAFSAWDEYISGRHLELVPGARIVQAWRAVDWPEGAWSIVTYRLTDVAGGLSRLDFEHLGVPADHAEAIAQGWHDHYWTPLSEWLATR